MSCPDWNRLHDLRDDRPEAWEEALEHLDGCGLCRDEALAAEPTLLFRRLPSPQVSRDELASIKQTVAAMCRSEAIQEPPRRRRDLLRAASLAAAVLAAAYVPGFLTAPEKGLPIADETTLAAVSTAGSTELSIAAGAPPSVSVVAGPRVAAEMVPLVEDVDPAYGSVVQVVDQEISLVLVLPNQGV